MARDNRHKLYIYVSPELDERFTEFATRFGITKSQFGNMCIQAGMSAIVRAVSPEDAFTPGQIVAIMRAAKDQGIDLEIDDLVKEKDHGKKQKSPA